MTTDKIKTSLSDIRNHSPWTGIFTHLQCPHWQPLTQLPPPNLRGRVVLKEEHGGILNNPILAVDGDL